MEGWILQPNKTSAGPQGVDGCLEYGMCTGNCFLDCDLCVLHFYSPEQF